MTRLTGSFPFLTIVPYSGSQLADLQVSDSLFSSILTEERRSLVNSCTDAESLAEDLRSVILTAGTLTMVEETNMLKG